MLGGISGTGVGYLLGLRQAAGKKPNGAKASGDGASASTPQSERQRAETEALDRLTMAVQNQKQQRKAAAKAKVDRLKQELESLRLMGGNSEAAARRAAQIARELAAAAKDYASSGGSGMAAPAGGGGANASAQAEAGAGEGAAENASAQAEAAAGEGAAENASAQAEAAAAEGAAENASADGETQETSDDPQADKAANGKAERERAAESGSDEDAKGNVADAFQQVAAEMMQKAAGKKADSEFAAEVRRLMAAAKSIVAQARRRAEQEGRADEAEDLDKQVRKAEADMEQSFAAAPELPFAPVNVVV